MMQLELPHINVLSKIDMVMDRAPHKSLKLNHFGLTGFGLKLQKGLQFLAKVDEQKMSSRA